MKKTFAFLLIPVITNAQTVIKRQGIALANPAIPTYPAVPLGLNVKENGNIVLYTSYLVSGEVRDAEKKEKKVSKFLSSISSAGGGNTPDAGIPKVNEIEYDAELKFFVENSKLVNYEPLEKDKSFTFNNQPISNDITELPSLFSMFPYSRVNTPAIEYAELAYKGKGLLGEKDKKYFPNFGGEVLKFKNNGSGHIENQLVDGSRIEENKTALDGLVPKYGNNMIFLKGNVIAAQSFFYADKDPDKYGEFKNYQFFTWDKEGNVLNKEMVNLPFAYDPEGVPIYNENKDAVGFFYLCKRADAGKKMLSPDVNSYYVLHFDAKGKLISSFETKLGTEENKISIAAVLSFKGETYFLAQDHQRKAESITVYKVTSAGLEKINRFDNATPALPKELIVNFWNNVRWGIAKNGNIYLLAQGVEKIKVMGMKTVTPLGVYLMTVTPDFATASGQKADFNDPLFNLKEFTIDVLDEQDNNFYLALTDKYKNVAAAILGPQKSSGLATIYTPGYAVYDQRKNYTYDAKTKCLYVITEETKNLSKGEIVKVKF